jgi:Flp pilus assembly protein TadG
MRIPIRRFLRCSHGNAAIELGIIFPIFVTLIVGVSQYGLAIFQIMEVGYAAQVGANYAITNGFKTGAIQTAVTSATALANITAPVPTQACGCASSTGISSAACGTTCPGTGAGPAGTYVTVNASVSYSPVLPGIPSPINAKAVVRIK